MSESLVADEIRRKVQSVLMGDGLSLTEAELREMGEAGKRGAKAGRRLAELCRAMSIPVRIEIPAVDGVDGSFPTKPKLGLNLDLTQAHSVAVQLEEQGFGYGAFWCNPPTVREALGILWHAIRGTEMRTKEQPSMKPWAEWVYCKHGEPPADQEQPPPPKK